MVDMREALGFYENSIFEEEFLIYRKSSKFLNTTLYEFATSNPANNVDPNGLITKREKCLNQCEAAFQVCAFKAVQGKDPRVIPAKLLICKLLYGICIRKCNSKLRCWHNLCSFRLGKIHFDANLCPKAICVWDCGFRRFKETEGQIKWINNRPHVDCKNAKQPSAVWHYDPVAKKTGPECPEGAKFV